MQDQKTPDEIAKENELPVREVKKIIKTGIEKMSLTSKELFAKKMWFQKIVDEKEILQNELAVLRKRFKHEIADKELTAAYERLNIPITNLFFSARAQTVFYYLNIKTLSDLADLKLSKLFTTRNAGPVTIKEIVAKALEFGITIT